MGAQTKFCNQNKREKNYKKFIQFLCEFCIRMGRLQCARGFDQKNIYGEQLEICSMNPVTGWYRDGFARTDENDFGSHTVCATMTEEFLTYTKQQGNDLSTPNAHFPGLKPG